MKDHMPEQESALLDLDGMTVLLLLPHPEDPFQEVGTESAAIEEEVSSVEPEEWLED